LFFKGEPENINLANDIKIPFGIISKFLEFSIKAKCIIFDRCNYVYYTQKKIFASKLNLFTYICFLNNSVLYA